MCNKDVLEICGISACFCIEINTSFGKSSCFQYYQHRFGEFIKIDRELIGIPTVLVIATVSIDTPKEPCIGCYLEIMLECMTGKSGVVDFDIQSEIFLQTKLTKESCHSGCVIIILMLGRFHWFWFDKEYTFESCLAPVIPGYCKEFAKVFQLFFHICI